MSYIATNSNYDEHWRFIKFSVFDDLTIVRERKHAGKNELIKQSFVKY